MIHRLSNLLPARLTDLQALQHVGGVIGRVRASQADHISRFVRDAGSSQRQLHVDHPDAWQRTRHTTKTKPDNNNVTSRRSLVTSDRSGRDSVRFMRPCRRRDPTAD